MLWLIALLVAKRLDGSKVLSDVGTVEGISVPIVDILQSKQIGALLVDNGTLGNKMHELNLLAN